MTRDHRRLAAIVSFDVAGYSRLMGLDEGGTLAALKAHRRELIDPKIAEHDGRIVKTTGDGLLLEFPSVVDAVRCAVEVQRGMAERNAGIAPEQRLDFRIGINVGDIIIDGDDIFGDGVNVAARVEALADPGGICVSRVVRDQVLDKLSFTFEDLGPQQVKNIARPVDVYRVNLDGGASAGTTPGPRMTQRARTPSWRWPAIAAFILGLLGTGFWVLPRFLAPASPPALPPLSLAVLPFAAPAGSVADEQLAQQLTVDLTSAMQRSAPWASIVSHGLAAAYKGKAIDARRVGNELNVRFLVEGEVRGTGKQQILKARLVETSKATEVWSEDLVLDDAQGAQDSQAPLARLTTQLRSAVLHSERARVLSRSVSDLSPAEIALRAETVIDRDSGSLAAWTEAGKLYDLALRKDSNEPAALMGQALTYAALLDLDPKKDHDRLVAAYERLTVRLVATAGREARAWNIRADALQRQWRWEAALEANAKAQALDPIRMNTVGQRANVFNSMGRPSEALALVDQTLQRLPTNDPTGTIPYLLHERCSACMALGRYNDAIAACEKSVSLSDTWYAHMFLVAGYALTGKAGKADAEKTILLARKPDFSIARYKSLRISNEPAYLEQMEAHLYAGLRKAGIPEK